MDGFDLNNLPDAFYDNPYLTYTRLRETAPVYPLPGGGWLLTRYSDIDAVYRQPKLFSSDKKVQFAPVFGEHSLVYAHHTTSLVFNDPPLHTRVRKAIGNALSRRVVESLEPGLNSLVERLIGNLSRGETVDLIAAYAAAIPVEIIGNLLGVPEDERVPLRRWSLAILGCLEPAPAPAILAEGEAAVSEFLAYLKEFVGRRQQIGHTSDDIVHRLQSWYDEAGGLTPDELYHQCIFLLNAGHETTTNLIGNGIELLASHPQEREKFLTQPDAVPSAIEEILRFESSNQLGNRTTTAPVAIGGVEIPADTVVTLCIGAANRDPGVFVQPDRFDISRTPNPHLAFAAGIHTCAGLNVARLEGCVALTRLFQAFPELRVVRKVRARRARFRGFSELLVEL